jgi:hypothetical protein
VTVPNIFLYSPPVCVCVFACLEALSRKHKAMTNVDQIFDKVRLRSAYKIWTYSNNGGNSHFLGSGALPYVFPTNLPKFPNKSWQFLQFSYVLI